MGFCATAVQIRSLGREDSLEEGMATSTVFLPGESMDRGAWWGTVKRVTKSQTGLKQLSMHSGYGIIFFCSRGKM